MYYWLWVFVSRLRGKVLVDFIHFSHFATSAPRSIPKETPWRAPRATVPSKSWWG